MPDISMTDHMGPKTDNEIREPSDLSRKRVAAKRVPLYWNGQRTLNTIFMSTPRVQGKPSRRVGSPCHLLDINTDRACRDV